ncbi:MAG: adenylyl-sulfate reductase subunit alpha [Firmicutes bacterium]|nr:adenylyl-sulfate reductase subunit alpha [Bacillota bacterium]
MAERVYIDTDLLIIGGGTAGCLAAWEARRVAGSDLKITILEKAFIRNSGCLAAGMNALNMYINQGTPEDYVAYVRYDMCGAPIREDIILSVAREVNETVSILEKAGLPMKKKEDGRYLNRGKWNIEINGSLLKPITASMAMEANAKIFNRVYVTNILVRDGKAAGAVGFGVRDGKFYIAGAKAVLLAAGGAAGLWRPANHGDAHHRIWYYPFNTGASYAMCKRIGCEMTGFDNRLVPVRTKDTYSPTGTLQIGMGAPMVNAKGEAFMRENPEYIKWGGHTAPTPIRVLGFIQETEKHRGPIYIDTSKGDPYKVAGLKSQYLDMSPCLVLYWGCNDIDPSKEPIEIDAADPSVVGSHACNAGAWTPKDDRMTTVPGLFVSGDALGGAPSRFISGSWTCGRIAGRHCVEYIKNNPDPAEIDPAEVDKQEELAFSPLKNYEELAKSGFWTDGTLKEGISPKQMEDRMQRIMEHYCGGKSRLFYVSEDYLKNARKLIARMRKDQIKYLCAKDLHDLQLAWDVLNRLDVCQLVVEHISFRKETRYPGSVNRTDFPDASDEFDCFCNSVWDPATDQLTFYKRPYIQIVPGDRKKQTI